MPRAYYRPFTAYEEALGFKAVKRNAYVFCALFFSGILLKLLLAYRFSPVSNRDLLASHGVDEDPRYINAMQQRAVLAENWMTRDSMKTATSRRRQQRESSGVAPPA